MPPDFEQAKANTRTVYQQYAKQWDKQRPRHLYERKWLERFVEAMPAEGSVLDLGCGAAEPVSGYLIEQKFQLTGVDYAQSMIDLAKTRFPEQQWLAQDMRALQLDKKFDGIISWDGFFHLSQDEQRQFFKSISRLLNGAATVLLTIGTGDGEVTGTVAGQTVYHASLAADEYRKILGNLGFTEIEIMLEYQDVLARSVLFAVRDPRLRGG